MGPKDMTELMDFIKDFTASSGSLPLIHTTDKFCLKSIRENKRLVAEEDDVYTGEKLVYLFYGRPSYRVNPDVSHTTASFFAPVCLIFDKELMQLASRMMPFDSGAHAAGLLGGIIHKKMDRSNFELELSVTSPAKLIRCFYGDESAYLENRPRNDFPDVQELQNDQKHYVEAYYHLVHHRSNSSQDERMNAIELQFNRDIEVAGNLKAVIVPSRFFSPELISEIESDFSATVIAYEMPAKYNPNELANTIYEKVYNFITSSLGP